MTRLRIVLWRLWALVRSRQMAREIDDEIASHLDEAIEELVGQGHGAEEARRIAQRRFGGVPQTREAYRQAGAFTWIEELLRDLRYGARSLRRHPAFTLTAVATLALAIGGNTAMFSVVDAVLLRPLPYHAPERLAMVWTENPAQQVREGRSALWDVAHWRRDSRTFADLATFDGVATELTDADGAARVAGASISPNLLSLLGVRPLAGRGFSPEDVARREPLALVSHRFWRARFASVDAALGATLVLDGVPSRIIGILPADFRVGRFEADVWRAHPTQPQARGSQTWHVIGRLRPGVTVAQAQAELSGISRRLSDALPVAERSQGVSVVPLGLSIVGPQSRLALWTLGGAVFFVFLIAAANVTSLSLARGTARARELALRAALGANGGRIVRQLLTESLLLAGLSGIAGTLLAVGGLRLIRAFGPANLPRLQDASLDWRVLVWALATSLLAGLLIGLAPAFTALRRDLRPSGEESGRTVSGGASTRRIRRALVVAEFALAIVLLVGAGLLMRSWWNVAAIDPGFRPERVLAMDVSPPASLRDPARRLDVYARTLEQLQAVPGVERVGAIDDLFTDNTREQVVTIERAAGVVAERVRFTRHEVSADLFRVLDTPLRRGRFFTAADRVDSPRVAIVNEAMARRAWPGQDPVGRRFVPVPSQGDGPWFTVVGVVADMRRQGLEREALPQVFLSLAQSHPPTDVTVLVRTTADDPMAAAGALRAAVRRVDPNAPTYGMATLEEQMGASLAQRRFQTSLLIGFSAVALLMATVGIYGLVQYSVATRTQEIGLRMAIGAGRRDILRLMIGEGLTLSLSGAVVGLVGAWWLGQAVSSLLFGVTATDPLTFAAVSLLLTLVAATACYIPARRAMAVDPITALRVT